MEYILLGDMMKFLKNLFYLFLPLIVGFLSSFFTSNAEATYEILQKPFLSPPAWVFPVVWTILFLLMGISFVILNQEETPEVSKATFWYYFQLIINFFWSIFFFRNGDFTFSFFWLLFLLVAVVITVVKFYRINRLAGSLLLPYLIWIVFAGYLNLAIAILN